MVVEMFLDLTPKTAIIANSLVVVVVTALIMRGVLWYRSGSGRQIITTDNVKLTAKNFGKEDETRRDAELECCTGATIVPPPQMKNETSDKFRKFLAFSEFF